MRAVHTEARSYMFCSCGVDAVLMTYCPCVDGAGKMNFHSNEGTLGETRLNPTT